MKNKPNTEFFLKLLLFVLCLIKIVDTYKAQVIQNQSLVSSQTKIDAHKKTNNEQAQVLSFFNSSSPKPRPSAR